MCQSLFDGMGTAGSVIMQLITSALLRKHGKSGWRMVWIMTLVVNFVGLFGMYRFFLKQIDLEQQVKEEGGASSNDEQHDNASLALAGHAGRAYSRYDGSTRHPLTGVGSSRQGGLQQQQHVL